MTTTYKFKANNEESYNSLAAYAATLPVTVTLIPRCLTIAIPEDASKEVGEFIDNKSLDFGVIVVRSDVDDVDEMLADPTTDASILREIATSFRNEKTAVANDYDALRGQADNLRLRLDETVKQRDRYQEWWRMENTKNGRIKEQIQAITVLIKSIYPEA